jgi:hypothetical protein
MAPVESFHEALIECCRAIGGSKAAAALLWPAKADRDIEGARRYLASCLDPDRNEKLSLDEVLLLLRSAREQGCHVGMEFLAATLGYEQPKPTSDADRRAKFMSRAEVLMAELASAMAELRKGGAT